MSFGAPYWLFALALVPALAAIFFSNERRRRALLERIVAARLQAELAGSVSLVKRRARFFLLLLGLACVIVSLAQPRYGYTWEQSKRRGRDVLIAIDTSKSMLSTDVMPNRLTRAKMAAQDLIGMLQGDRVGLVAFAGSAFLQAPLTIDYSAVVDSINELDTNIIPRGGTDIGAAIQCAAEAFGKGESDNRCLILITDGEDLGNAAVEAARREKDNFRIFTAGVGTTAGSIIPVPEEQGGTDFVKGPNGEFVKSHLDEACLRQIADATGGFYTHLDNGPETMKRIVTEGFDKVRERDIDARLSRRPIERYQWPLALGLALLAAALLIGERKRNGASGNSRSIANAALVALLLLLPAMAFGRNAGLDLYDQQDYKDAYRLFEKQLGNNTGSEGLQFDAGTAAYKLGEYDKALDSFSKALAAHDPAMRSDVEYNLGNTLVRRGELQQDKEAKIKEWQNALQHYDEAMKTDAKNENAKYNRDMVEKMIKELEKKPPKQDQSKQDQSKQDQSKQDQSKQDQSKQDQSKQDQSKQDQSKQDQSKQDQSKQDQSKQDQSKQDQSKQDQSKQDQSKQDQSKQDQSKQDQSKQDQSKQDQSKQDQSKQDQSKQDQSKQDQSKQDQSKQNENQPPQNGQPQPGNESKQNQPQGSPTPRPGQPDKKLSGDIKEQSPQNGEKSGSKEQAAGEVPAQPGEMTEAQARALVDSLKDEEQRVDLNEHKGAVPVLKDW